MKAVVWHGKADVRVEQVPDPFIQNPGDVIIKVSLTAICGTDLHTYEEINPNMQRGSILGHEFMGEVIETGPEVTRVQKGDRVVVPSPIACGGCYFCKNAMQALCDNSNPNAVAAEKIYGFAPAGIFGSSTLMGAFPGGQAQFVRVPYGDVGPFKVPQKLSDEQVLFLGDIFPTGYMAAENCHIKSGDTIAIWGAGPVGQFALRSALLLGAERVIMIDRIKSRLELSSLRTPKDKVFALNFEEIDIDLALKELTGGRGPDACIDAVGLEAHGKGSWFPYEQLKQALHLNQDPSTVLREMIKACRKGGTISIPGLYETLVDKFPMGSVFHKGLHIQAGQPHVHRYLKPLLTLIENEALDPSFVISHRMNLDEAPLAYDLLSKRDEHCMKVVMRPWS